MMCVWHPGTVGTWDAGRLTSGQELGKKFEEWVTSINENDEKYGTGFRGGVKKLKRQCNKGARGQREQPGDFSSGWPVDASWLTHGLDNKIQGAAHWLGI